MYSLNIPILKQNKIPMMKPSQKFHKESSNKIKKLTRNSQNKKLPTYHKLKQSRKLKL